ncbi:hypothetical protein ACIQW7_27815 [Peribacillus simplex]
MNERCITQEKLDKFKTHMEKERLEQQEKKDKLESAYIEGRLTTAQYQG